jgi:hypothetical protein
VENIVSYHLNDNIPQTVGELLARAKANLVGKIVKWLKELFEDN